MNVEIKNLGILKQASISLNDFTIVCGENNTGKSYAAYALFGFLKYWRHYLPLQKLNEHVDSVLRDGVIRIDVSQYLQKANSILEKGCDRYAGDLSEIFASKSNQFTDAKFQIKFEESEYSIERKFHRSCKTSNQERVLSADKKESSNELVISLLMAKSDTDHFPKHVINDFISNSIHELLFQPLFPKPFIASAERTGATIFCKELIFARNRLLEEMMKNGENLDPMNLLFKSYQAYSLPVKTNVEFTINLQSVARRSSVVADDHPNLIQEFTDILGGEYSIDKDDTIRFKPKGTARILEMDESSSSVRSLLDLGFYLRHIAQKGDLLLIDEPERNLHPRNQCRIARLLVRLMNMGIKVFVTTHSDYLLKELNTLIMLNGEEPHLKEIADREQYHASELLDANRISVYIAEKALVKFDGNNKRTRCHTLKPATIDNKLGIEVTSFDSVIDKMNNIQEEIIWAGE